MDSYGQDWGAPADFKTILEQVSSDDIMFCYEGVSQLRLALNVVDDRSMNKFPVDAFCQKLVKVIRQPVIMEEISNEIKCKNFSFNFFKISDGDPISNQYS